MNITLLLESFFTILKGIPITLTMVIFSLFGGLLLGIILLYLQRIFFIKNIINAYIFFFRGTPFFLQLFLIYYGLGDIVSNFIDINNKDSFLVDLLLNPFFYAILALILNSSAYSIGMIKSGLNSIPKGQIQAGIALGMNKPIILKRIIIPQIFSYTLPVYSNEAIALVKASSLASTITIMDITAIMSQIRSQTYSFLEPFIVSACFYLVINFIFINIFRYLETKSSKWIYQK
jgi:octopine/nopaline transport system permease protein